MTRVAHYVASTHWDREWYEPLQGFRMRLVSLLDEVFATLERDAAFKTFVMDGQTIPVHDYLEIRPEKLETVRQYVRQGRFRVGPWYVLPDEWLVSGESIVRNLQLGTMWAIELGSPASRAGIVCDQFGHIGQLPQIFNQLGIPGAFVWRGTHEREYGGHFNWQSPDGTSIPTYRFGIVGYSTYAFRVRDADKPDKPFDLGEAVEKLVQYTLHEAGRSPVQPILLFDGGDHMEIEPQTSALLARANEKLAEHGIQITHSDLDKYLADLLEDRNKIEKTYTGELRETGRDAAREDEHWLIPGVLSSRIHLKQKNAACEDELCLWAEPFSAFAQELGLAYPVGYLRVAWRHLLENHPHDSMCGCSIDQVHQDMIYRFDQSLGISSRLTKAALNAIAQAAAPQQRPDGSLLLAIFNPTAEPLDMPVDLDIPLPAIWPKRYQEFFGFEEKFAFVLRDASGAAIPYQLVGQQRDVNGFRRPRYKFPTGDRRHVVTVTARVKVPEYGYTTIVVEPVDGPTRYLGSMATSHRSIENDLLRVEANPNGTIKITDKQTGASFDQLLTFEQRADIGDGWYHGIAVNDQIFNSTAGSADIALVADGINKATLRIALTMNVPAEFDFKHMTRSERIVPLRIVSEVTLREGADHVEVTTTIDNTVLDHRIRVLFPTNLDGDSYLSDSAYDVVERPVTLAADNNIRRELEVETRPQITWTAFGDDQRGLAIVSRGLPESALLDTAERPIALTLLRAFRRAVFSNDNMGGEIQGKHTFRYDIVPFTGKTPLQKLFLLGQRVNGAIRVVDLLPGQNGSGSLPREHSFLAVDGNVVVTSVQAEDNALLVRLFNPHNQAEQATIKPAIQASSARSITLGGRDDTATNVKMQDGAVAATIPPKRIATITVEV